MTETQQNTTNYIDNMFLTRDPDEMETQEVIAPPFAYDKKEKKLTYEGLAIPPVLLERINDSEFRSSLNATLKTLTLDQFNAALRRFINVFYHDDKSSHEKVRQAVTQLAQSLKLSK